jgi:hypothetical protein
VLVNVNVDVPIRPINPTITAAVLEIYPDLAMVSLRNIFLSGFAGSVFKPNVLKFRAKKNGLSEAFASCYCLRVNVETPMRYSFGLKCGLLSCVYINSILDIGTHEW